MPRKRTLDSRGTAATLAGNPPLLGSFLYYLDCFLHEEAGKRYTLGHMKIERYLRHTISRVEVARDAIIRKNKGAFEVCERDREMKKLANAYVRNFYELGNLFRALAPKFLAINDPQGESLAPVFLDACQFMAYASKIDARRPKSVSEFESEFD